MSWFTFSANANGIFSVITSNAAGRQFFTVYGNTYGIKSQLSNMGFRFFQGRWGTALDFLKSNPARISELQSLGVDTSIIDQSPTPQQPQQPQQTQIPTEVQTQDPQKPVSAVDQQLASMKLEVEKAIQEAGAASGEKVKAILNHVDKVIEQLASQVDEAKASEFVRSFLSFAAKFHNYSFGNQILIWVQNPNSTNVAGAKVWFSKFGREVTNWEKAISIIAPRTGINAQGKTLKKTMSPEQWNTVKSKYEYMYFVPASVYDIADTKVVSGWQGPNGEKPYETPKRQDDNNPMEEVAALVNAATSWARGMGISVESEKMEEAKGGYSAGGKIRINDTFDGINKFSTLVHEISHEVLHQTTSGRAEIKDKQVSRQYLEIDAETASYIVLSHYGFQSKDTPNYLALWRATGEDVKKRRDNITKAVRTIIHGIDKTIGQEKFDVSEQEVEV